jgi:hypothetical protein
MRPDFAGDALTARPAIRVLISWIANISGYVKTIVQEIAKPSCAPAWL